MSQAVSESSTIHIVATTARARRAHVFTLGPLEATSVTGYALPALCLQCADAVALASATLTCTGVLGLPYNLIITSCAQQFIVGRSHENGWPGRKFGALEIAGVYIGLSDSVVPEYDRFYAALAHVGLSSHTQAQWEQGVVGALSGRTGE
jgi:hypothetical protein